MAKRLDLSAKRRALLGELLPHEEPPAAPPAPEREDGPPPLSFAQQRLWFLDQYETDRPVYNIPLRMPLQGSVDPRAVEAAVREIVRRHGALRTTFRVVDGRPVQHVAPPGDFAVPLIDLRGLPEDERRRRLDELAAAEHEHRFDLVRGPLFRASLVRLGNTEHVLLLTTHHIVSDGWSMGILLGEFDALYAAFSSGRPSPLPELALQYTDFARRQRDELRGERLESLIGFWRRKLGDAPPTIELPTDRPRPKLQTFNGETQLFRVPKAVAQQLAELGRKSGVTTFMTLLAAFEVLLARWTGRTDLVLGTPIANRNRAEIEPLIGFFVNTLVLRTDLAGNPTFRELLQRVREVTLEAYAHQDLPFEKLVEELQPERDPAHTPVIQVLFALQNLPTMVNGMAGADHGDSGEPTVVAGNARFDMSLFMAEVDNGLVGELEYNSDLFDTATIARLIARFQRALAALAADPEGRIADVPLMDEDERRALEASWSGPRADVPHVGAHALFEASAARDPGAAAALFGERRISYGELDERANRFARYLQAAGVGPEVRVGMCLDRSFDMLVTILGIWKAGGTYVPLDPAYPAARLAFMLEDSRAAVVVTRAGLRDRLPPARARVVVLDAERDAIAAHPASAPPCAASDDNLAYVIYTSGSTGRPKGVAMSHRPLVNLVEWQAKADAPKPGARVLQFMALSFDVSLQEMFFAWTAGGTLVLVDDERRGDFDALAATIAEQSVERMFLPPVALPGILDALVNAGRPLALREIVCVGEQLTLTPATLRALAQLGAGLRNHYGPSETHVCTDYPFAGPHAAWPAVPPIGRPIDNTRAYVLDEELRPVPVGIVGELYMGGDCVARGYLDRPALTAERFLPDPFGAPGARMYKTGDRVRLLPDGNLAFLGRLDQQVKVRGFRIETAEIEAVLLEFPGVRHATVIDHRDPASGIVSLAAYLVAAPDAAASSAELRAFLADRLPQHMIPAAFVKLDALPLTPSGKVDRRALPAPEASQHAEHALVPPRSALEAAIAGIWREVLGVAEIGAEDNFFELGGHSLLATQVVSRLRRAFAVDVPLRRMFEQPSTVAKLARTVVAGLAEHLPASEVERVLDEVEALTDDEAALEIAACAT